MFVRAVFFTVLLCASFGAYALRVVSLSPNLTELVCHIGACKELVAVGTASNYPQQVKKLPYIGGYENINIEKLLSLRPDVVLTWRGANPASMVAKMRRFGINVVQLKAKTLPEIAGVMRKLGGLLQHKAQAEQAAVAFMRQYKQLKQHYSHNSQHPRVMLQYANNPLYVAGGIGLQNQVIQLCGGKNIFAEVKRPALLANKETVLNRNPQVIIGMSPIDLSAWKKWPELAAVKSKRVYSMQADLLAQANSRILLGAVRLCQLTNNAANTSLPSLASKL